ncbi:hypothetical protein BGW80DRAFT_1466360 [Lactifluus volemus]|nr:hypothetical protein BGW80DRAFT_1466360 [Lactifluus volemus]
MAKNKHPLFILKELQTLPFNFCVTLFWSFSPPPLPLPLLEGIIMIVFEGLSLVSYINTRVSTI